MGLCLGLTCALALPPALAWTEADRVAADGIIERQLEAQRAAAAKAQAEVQAEVQPQSPKALKPAAGPTPTPKPAEVVPVAAPVASEAVRLIDASMVKIPAGSFQMGCSLGDGVCYEWEKPPHQVQVLGFRMGKTEVTQAQWQAVMGENPSSFKGDDRPVETISWDDAQAFLKRINANNPGKPYRLPSEAEWEYAARAGTTTAYWWGKDLGKGNANCSECGGQWAGKETAPVGSFKANPFGLLDTAGNAWEWVQDCWHDSYTGAPTDGTEWRDNCSDARRVFRGGSWSGSGRNSRVSGRYRVGAGGRNDYLGLRLAQDL